jgi:RND family efflux transporter MFP subunit
MMLRFATIALAALLASCGRNTYEPPPPAEVTVAQPIEQEVTTYSEFTGHTAAIEAVDIRARVQGFLKSFHFTPGTDVKQGDLLFVIEPELYEAQAEQAAADLQSAQARAQAAEAQLGITRAIFERQAGSKTDLVEKTQARDEANAAVALAKAQLAAAKLNLSYTHIYAPIPGRIDRNLVDPGNLVGSGDATLLANIVRNDPIYAYFDASERELLRYREMQRRGETAAPAGERNKAYMGLATEDGFPHVGEVDYSDNRVDPTTGTIEIRAVFPNTERTLIPGLFARVRLPLSREKALLVPDVAVGTDQGGRYLLVVDDKNVVDYRQVKLGSLVGEMRVVYEGVKPGEWVVVNGLQHARPGSTVKPVRDPSPPAPPTADATSPTP